MSVLSKTGIVNEALDLIRAEGNISDWQNDDSPNAKSARRYIDQHIREAMAEYDWASFRSSETMDNISDSDPSPGHYLYRYSMPSDCLVPRRIIVSATDPNDTPYSFEIEQLAGGGQRSILTDVDPDNSPCLIFTSDAQLENVQNWPPHFYRAIVYRLAASLATAVKESPQLAQGMMQFYVDSLSMAWYVDQSGRYIGKNQDPQSIRARRGEAL